MKTLVLNENLVSTDMFTDDTILMIDEQKITVGLPEEYIISYANSLNSIVYKQVEKPDDWIPIKYKYIEGEFVLNSDYVKSPESVEQTPPE